jgi:hypothetical protein
LPSPRRFENRGSLFKINEDRYAIQVKEFFPLAISTVGEGIECFDFSYSRGCVAYVGEKDKLISKGIAEADMFVDEDGKEKTAPNAHGYKLVLEETTRLHSGKWAYLKYPQHIQEAEEVERQSAERGLYSTRRRRSNRQWLLKMVNVVSTFVELAPVETKAGQKYSIDAESKEAIEEAWRDLQWAIRDAVIHIRMVPPKLTEKEKAARRDKYADTQNDRAFKAFVQDLLPRVN